MTNRLCFVNPSELRLFSEEPNKPEYVKGSNVVIDLLHPLSDPSILQACRDPESRYARDPAGNKCCETNNEYLNLRKFGKVWRSEWKTFIETSKESLASITFNAKLPQYQDESGALRQLFWESQDGFDEAIGKGVALAVVTQDFTNLVITLSTETRMLSGGGIKLSIAEDSMKAWPEDHQKRVKRYLETLSQ